MVMGEVGGSLDRSGLRVTSSQYKGLLDNGTRFKRNAIGSSGLLLPILWFAVTFWVARPFVQGPVADSWIYLRAVRNLRAGVFALPGFTAAMPVAQIVYGALWTRLFGLSYLALYCSVAILGIAGAMLFYALARRCNADRYGATLATALLIANPCYLFLSFSFMTDVPFVSMLIAAHLAFAMAERGREVSRLWICAALLIGAFLVRPFALAALAGSGAALMLAHRPGASSALSRLLAPFIAALAICVMIWLWLTAVRPAPWMLAMRAHWFTYLYLVSVAGYLTRGLLAPFLYLGLVLSPLALPHLFTPRWRVGLVIAAALAAITLPLLKSDPGARSIPELSCCGGWDNALVLRGPPTRFLWGQPLRLVVVALGILGATGLAQAALAVEAPNRGFLAVVITAAIYWGGTLPLWFFNDRYYLVMLPAGCLVLAAAPRPAGVALRAASLVLLAALGWFAVAGVYDQQRGLEAVMAIRDALLHDGTPRSAIDAGYPLNGEDLYRNPPPGQQETFQTEAGIPMITSGELEDYTIANTPESGAVVIRRVEWPGILGIGRRYLYLLKTIAPVPSAGNVPALRTEQLPASTKPPPPPTLIVALTRLAAMALMMIAPLIAVLAIHRGGVRDEDSGKL
jgi:hypothetical protein